MLSLRSIRALLAECHLHMLGALDVGLSKDDIARIEDAIPADSVAGTRYGADQMARLDSERG